MESKVDCYVHKSPPFVSILNQMNPTYGFSTYFFKIHFTIILSTPRLFKWSLSFRFFQTKILHSSFSMLISGKHYKLRSPSIYSFLWPPVNSSLLGPNILLSPSSQTHSVCFFLSFNVTDQGDSHKKL